MSKSKGFMGGLLGGGGKGGRMQSLGGEAGFLFGLWAGGGQAIMAQKDPKLMLNEALYQYTGISLTASTGAFQGWDLWRPVANWSYAFIGRALGRFAGRLGDRVGLGSMLG